MTALARRQLGRSDRYVRKARLNLAAGAPHRKLAFLTEEALRLCSLPGEEAGRVYYFRRLRIAGLSENGDRRAWLEAFHRAMQEQASAAIHGSDSRAPAADAVYFLSHQEACETLLSRIAARAPATAWFWPHVSGVDATASAPAQLVAVIEKLLATPAAWTALAAAVLATARRHDPIPLLRFLPDRAIARWLRELGAPALAYAAPVRLPESLLPSIEKAIAAFGADAPQVLWLAALAVVALDPASVQRQSAIAIARAALRPYLAAPLTASPAREPAAESVPPAPALPHPEQENHAAPFSPAAAPSPAASSNPPLRPARDSAAQPPSEFCFGEPTAGAGLYFLLNALRHLGAAQQNFTLLFLARLFLRIASHAEIAPADPILRWAQAIEAQSEPENIDLRLLRLWMLRIRRWCWRNGRIRMREIVRRPGYVTLTRTDLDVTLAIESADVRIRRIGLDLDPGWLPWFGRVVRFHYRYRGDLRA